jgi:hypothetical protein
MATSAPAWLPRLAIGVEAIVPAANGLGALSLAGEAARAGALAGLPREAGLRSVIRWLALSLEQVLARRLCHVLTR